MSFSYNETKGRDGYMLAYGRKVYYVYKQNFPMAYIYGLRPEDNRETSEQLFDVRTLPTYEEMMAHCATDEPLSPRARAARREEHFRKPHWLAFALLFARGFDFNAHIAREEERYKQEAIDAVAHRLAARQSNPIELDDDEIPF